MKTLTTTIYKCEHCATTRLNEKSMLVHEQLCEKNLDNEPACASCINCLEAEVPHTPYGTSYQCHSLVGGQDLFSFEQERHRRENKLPLADRDSKYLMYRTCGNYKSLAQLTA